jgi:hypothetical protein
MFVTRFYKNALFALFSSTDPSENFRQLAF